MHESGMAWLAIYLLFGLHYLLWVPSLTLFVLLDMTPHGCNTYGIGYLGIYLFFEAQDLKFLRIEPISQVFRYFKFTKCRIADPNSWTQLLCIYSNIQLIALEIIYFISSWHIFVSWYLFCASPTESWCYQILPLCDSADFLCDKNVRTFHSCD